MKKKFLSTLKAYLEPLSKEERDEILRFYEERFETSMLYEGKSEQEVIDELETPRQIARNVLIEYGYGFSDKKPIEEPSDKVKSGSLIGLILFDLLTVLLIIPFFFSLFVGFVSGWIGLLSRMSVSSSYAFMFLLGFGFLWFLVILWLYDIIINFASWLVRWHVDVLKFNRARPVVKRMNRLQVAYVYKRNPRLKKWKNALALIALVAIFVGGITSVVHGVAWRFNLSDNPLQETIETKEMSSSIELEETWVIESDLAIGRVRIVRGDSSVLHITSNELEDFPVTITIDEDTRRIAVENTVERRLFAFDFFWTLFGEQPEVIIEVPEDLVISHIQIKGENGSVYINDIVTEEIIVDTLNAGVYFRNVRANTVNIQTTNGRIEFRDVSISQDINANTTNGKIDFSRVEAEWIYVNTTNGAIELRNIHVSDTPGARLDAKTTNGGITLVDVYVLWVDLATTNGNVTYHNADQSFVLDRIRAATTNGSKNVTVNADVTVNP